MYPGSDPDAAARSAYLEWDKIFSAFPASGLYTAKLSMIETDNGYAILVQATVDKAASRNDDDDDEPEEPEDSGYTVDDGNYTVTTADGLKNVAKLVNEEGKTDIDITLTGNIDLTGEWTPIGTESQPYTGTFDGGGHTIKGLTVTTSDQYAGLFGYIDDGGKVKDVKLENVQITSDNQYADVGGVAGDSWGTIENCSVSGGSVSGYSAGGMVGSQWGGFITGCNSSATVNGTGSVGGVVGQTNYGASLTGCYATGDVTLVSNDIGTCYAGGVVGYNGGGTPLTACYATGSVTGSGSGTVYVGGVTGSNDLGTLTACYHATGTVSGPDAYTGGVTGRNYDATVGIPSITACYWSGQVSGGNGIGYQVDSTTVTWKTAMDAMNTKLTGENWQYVEGDGSAPLTLKKN